MRRVFLVAGILMILVTTAGPKASAAEPAKKPSERTVSVRVFNQAELNALFKTVCSANASQVKGETGDDFIAKLEAADCSTACCAHCTRCANDTGSNPAGDCAYCDLHCDAT
jgi:hypothetical protein